MEPDGPEIQWAVRFDRANGWHVSPCDSEYQAREWAARETERGLKATAVSRTVTYGEWESGG